MTPGEESGNPPRDLRIEGGHQLTRTPDKSSDLSAKTLEEIFFYEDNGVGVPSEEKGYIFDHWHGKHTGIGLFLAQEILAITGISIRECGVYGEGARFEILVPAGKFHMAARLDTQSTN